MRARFVQFVKERVGVVMKAFYISAGQQKGRISGAAEIELWNAAVIHAAKITGGYGGFCSFTGVEHGLSAEEGLGRSVGGPAGGPVVNQRLHGREQLHALVYRQLDDFIEACPGTEFRRVARREAPGLEL